jgi:UDP-glucose 4-epimerase
MALEKVTGRKVPTYIGPRCAGDPAELVANLAEKFASPP